MKIRNGFALREVAGRKVALPAGDALDLNTMITLNETAAFLWELLQNNMDEDALVSALLKEYDVDEITARRSVQNFVKKLSDNGFIE